MKIQSNSFKDKLNDDFIESDSFILKVIFMQWILVSTFGGYFYNTYTYGFISGAFLFLLAYIGFVYYRGEVVLRILNAIILMTFSIILIQQNMGLIEMHFHIFAMLSFLVAYKDIKAITFAGIFIIMHHLLFTYLQLNALTFFGTSVVVFSNECSYEIAFLHAFFVLFEMIVLIYLAQKNINKNFEMLENEAKISLLNEELLLNKNNLQKEILLQTNDLIHAKNDALNASRVKSEFLANMSHEIRTPLNAILGFIDLIKDENINTKLSEYLNIIESSSNNLLKIIEDILDFSKIEKGKMCTKKIDFECKKEIEIIIHLFDAKSDEKNIKLQLEFDRDLPKVINSDPLRIRQVITNLLSNAIKFTSNNKIVYIHVSFKDSKLFVTVRDEGKGIEKEKLSTIFDSFSQEDNSATREYGGTGLGLSISKELIILLGGEIKVQSELYVGSIFSFWIPVSIGSEIKKSVNKKSNSTFENKKILLVEDNKSNQMFMKIFFKKLRFEYDIANDGIEGVMLFKNNEYDLILMDENMPNMSGIEATGNILKYEKENNLKHTPIVALTANAIKGDRERFLSAGMDEYLTKPLDKEKFKKLMDKIFS